jgi:hypothetical protein
MHLHIAEQGEVRAGVKRNHLPLDGRALAKRRERSRFQLVTPLAQDVNLTLRSDPMNQRNVF